MVYNNLYFFLENIFKFYKMDLFKKLENIVLIKNHNKIKITDLNGKYLINVFFENKINKNEFDEIVYIILEYLEVDTNIFYKNEKNSKYLYSHFVKKDNNQKAKRLSFIDDYE